MPPKTQNKERGERRILGRIEPDDFIGRASELERVVALASARGARARGLLVLAAPSVGLSELLRQSYDEIFRKHDQIVPVYFAFSADDKTNSAAARRFFQTFIQQLVAWRRKD